MWVEAARRWAAQGVPSVRLDLIGIGEGGGPATPWNGEYALYDDALVQQVAIALDALPGHGLPPRFLLIGMCSGSYWAFTRALQDPRIVALELLNTRMLLFDQTRGSAAEVRHLRRLGGREVWRDVLAGKLTWDARAGCCARSRSWSRARRSWSPAGCAPRRAVATRSTSRSTQLRDQGTEISLRFTEGEPLQDELARSGHLARLERWPNVAVRPLPGPADAHTLQVVRMQPAVHRELDAFLAQQLART